MALNIKHVILSDWFQHLLNFYILCPVELFKWKKVCKKIWNYRHNYYMRRDTLYTYRLSSFITKNNIIGLNPGYAAYPINYDVIKIAESINMSNVVSLKLGLTIDRPIEYAKYFKSLRYLDFSPQINYFNPINSIQSQDIIFPKLEVLIIRSSFKIHNEMFLQLPKLKIFACMHDSLDFEPPISVEQVYLISYPKSQFKLSKIRPFAVTFYSDDIFTLFESRILYSDAF